MDTQRREALEFMVAFANMDLDHLKPGDKAKFMVEAAEYLWPLSELEEILTSVHAGECHPRHPADIKREAVEELKSLAAMEGFKNWAWSLKPPREDSDEFWELARVLHAITRSTLSLFCTVGDDMKRGRDPGELGRMSLPYKFLLRPTWSAPDGNFKLAQFPITDDPVLYVELKIFRLMDGLWMFALGECPACRRFFLNFSRRIQRYCSTRCMSRVNTEKYRKANPEQYKEYQREFMRKKYEKARKAQLGPNVVIQKKPRKPRTKPG